MTETIEQGIGALGWTPEEESRIAEIIASFNAAEVSRILTYSTLRMEAIRRMRYEQMRNAPLPVVKVKMPSNVQRAQLARDRWLARLRADDRNPA